MQNYSPSPFGERGVSPFAYWLGLTLKYFLKTSRKYFPSQKPVLSATSVTEYKGGETMRVKVRSV